MLFTSQSHIILILSLILSLNLPISSIPTINAYLMPSLFNAILFMFLNLYHNALLLLLLVLFSSKAFLMSYQIYLSQKQLFFFFLQLSCLKCFCGCSLYLVRWSESSLLCYRNSLFYISNLTYHKSYCLACYVPVTPTKYTSLNEP